MNKKLLKLLNKINAQEELVFKLIDEDKVDEAAEAKVKLFEMQNMYEELEAKYNKEPDPEHLVPFENPATATPEAKDEVKEFLNGVRHNFQNASYLKENSDEDGGVTVPQDIQTKINHYRDAKFSFDSLVSHETTSTVTGSRVYMNDSDIDGFVEFTEDDDLSQIANFKFGTIKYKIRDFGGFMPITNNLLADSDAKLENEIAKWFGNYSRVTRNKDILKKLDEGKTETGQSTPTYQVVKTLQDITTLINVNLGTVYKDDAVLITNDFGINMMDRWVDANGRSLLQPMPNEPKQRQLCFGTVTIPVKVINKKDFKNIKVSDKEYAPIIIGDLSTAIKIFDRKKLSLDSSKYATVGNFSAYGKNMTLFRGIERFDTVLQDSNAYVLGYFGTALTAAELAVKK